MNRVYFQIAKWIAEYLSNAEQAQENAQWKEWRKEPKNEELLRKIERNSRLKLEKKRYNDFSCNAGWRALQAKRFPKRRLPAYRRWMRYAAILLLFIGSVMGVRLLSDRKGPAAIPEVVQEIKPGSARAKLILADGKEINLEKQQGILADSLPFIRNSGNRLTYQSAPSAEKSLPVYHEVVIPACGEYQLKLSDGTLVFLNAMTKLRFPEFFCDSVREVELEGEAYFEVVKDPEHPFVVKSLHSKAFVYGTQFNISAYPDEKETHTTLVEGVLTVEHAGRSQKLQPGEQWHYRLDMETAEIQTVDVTLYIAWKEGKLRFNDARLEDIMRTVKRWYGVEVSYQEEGLKELRFGCNFNRHASIEPLLRVFEANGKIKIERNGKQLKIKRGR